MARFVITSQGWRTPDEVTRLLPAGSRLVIPDPDPDASLFIVEGNREELEGAFHTSEGWLVLPDTLTDHVTRELGSDPNAFFSPDEDTD